MGSAGVVGSLLAPGGFIDSDVWTRTRHKDRIGGLEGGNREVASLPVVFCFSKTHCPGQWRIVEAGYHDETSCRVLRWRFRLRNKRSTLLEIQP